ncbi:hypothetical protein [Leucobacter sp. W1478]|uniref:hypothetical protein n=1 Tax=Leucobacter sp. W1478 TaxID=3439065 RepID=UPI003F2CE8DC
MQENWENSELLDSQDSPLRLMGGLNFSTWPDLKWSRAKRHLASLEASFTEWHASAPVSAECVTRADQLGIDIMARVPRGIPSHNWALILGDAIHNLRSAFDAVAWGMAHFYEIEPSRPKRVTFPICSTEKQWRDALSDWVSEIRPDLIERLRLMQPFTYAPAGAKTVLEILHELDIQDKHRDILEVTIDLHSVDMNMSFKYQDERTDAAPHLELFPDALFRDGVLLGTIHAGAPIETLGKSVLLPTVKVQLTFQETTYDVLELLKQLITESRRHLDILMGGLAPLVEEEADWHPVDIKSTIGDPSQTTPPMP